MFFNAALYHFCTKSFIFANSLNKNRAACKRYIFFNIVYKISCRILTRVYNATGFYLRTICEPYILRAISHNGLATGNFNRTEKDNGYKKHPTILVLNTGNDEKVSKAEYQ